jgi:hypothetical protein
MQSMSKSRRLISPIFALLLGACGERNIAPAKSPPQTTEAQFQAQWGAIVRSYAEEDAGLLAAKYHISPKVAEAIIVEVRMSDNILLRLMTSPAPKSETMTQIIERVSTTYQVKPDVVASLIVDELLLERTGNQPK